ncbi:hypothetical protein CSUB01_05292 [Colletotrichum sublineola]|uniref:J domain-containing protein n=1 Tax=Colletotrichum sublineola TaxID=1173701 RepID=A0A066XH16_COLSU|nr:hypothetical protein CSUB01_05292 [Colletotrichum sublineola]
MQQPSTPDHYGDLGIQQSAALPQIRKAYLEQAKKYHPDKQAPGETIDAEDFRRVQEAWEVLRDESRRAEYDQGYADIHREWQKYRKWQKSVDPFEIRRRAREREKRRRARKTEEVRRQARLLREGFEAAGRELDAASSRLERERIEREKMAAERDECRRRMESTDSWMEEAERLLKMILEDVAKM